MMRIYSDSRCPKTVVASLPTPCYLISEDHIRKNCILLEEVKRRSGAKILLALKAFALPALFPLISSYLDGVCASGPTEARLGREDFGREVHTYSPAYSDDQMERVINYSDVIVFNSKNQFKKHLPAIQQSGKCISLGLRVNPGYSEVEVDLYNPCLPGSRFGLTASALAEMDGENIEGLHFHAMCEQGADVLFRILQEFERLFHPFLPGLQWVNFGGGHHITKEGYDVDLLCETILAFKRRYGVEVILEPGEAVVLNGGFFLTQVLDLISNGMDIAVVDSSAETHLPDVLAMPYRPEIPQSGLPQELPHTYRVGGISCLAGDVFGDYSFAQPLAQGDRLVFTDMALYTFVKNTTFNGVELPAIYSFSQEKQSIQCIRSFGYDDYRSRLA